MKNAMPNIQFRSGGYLNDEVHQLTFEEFVSFFCDAENFHVSSNRGGYIAPLKDLYEWARAKGVRSLVIGGSFITDKRDPEDIDILALFGSSLGFDRAPKSARGTQAILDVQSLSEDEPELLQAYLQLLGNDRGGIGRGLVQIKLHPHAAMLVKSETRSNLLHAATLSYGYRSRSKQSNAGKLVIPIHGIRSNAPWVPKFTFLASTSGWSVAPFVYGFESGTILRNKARKSEVVNEFRMWIDEIRKVFDGSISVVAHSFGTYILGRYLQDAGFLQEPLTGVVLTGSILSEDFPWDEHLESLDIIKVLNTRTDNDGLVSMLPEGGVRYLAEDELMGPAAVKGFRQPHDRLIERSCNLLDHNNMFEQDVISRLWLPFLDLAEKEAKVIEGACHLDSLVQR